MLLAMGQGLKIIKFGKNCEIASASSSKELKQQTFELLPEHCFIPEFTHFSDVISILSDPLILPAHKISR